MLAPAAAALLKSHNVRIARAIARQTQGLVDRYRTMDISILEKNISVTLSGAQVLLETGDETKMMKTLEYVVQIRTISGFQTADFLMAWLNFLPVMRRFLLERLPVKQAMAEYDVVEAIALPMMGRVVTMFEEAQKAFEESETPVPVEFAKVFPTALRPVKVEAVTGEDNEETEVDRPRPF